MFDYDTLVEFAIRHLLQEAGRATTLAPALARSWPEARPLDLLLVMALAADSIETTLAGDQATRAAQEVWRVATLFAVEVLALQAEGAPGSGAADLAAIFSGQSGRR